MRRLLAALGLLALLTTACSAEQPPAPAPPTAGSACSGPPTVTVANGDELIEALAGAKPGAVIGLRPGTYSGSFVATTTGTPEAPIAMCGPREAVLDGGANDGDYTLHLDGVSHWQLSGFTVSGGQKGVMVDAGQANVVEGLLVERIGDEAIHLRRASSDNVVRGNTIRNTGLRNEKFGEGVYIGSAESNWCELTACEPDRSDRNLIEGNTIYGTTSESVDIKEGTTGGVLRGNTFSGEGMTEAESWVDIKGNGWLITGNTGSGTPEDGYQVHEILDGWGVDNVFEANLSTIDADGFAINVTKNPERNRVACDNTADGAGKGLTRKACA